MGYLIEDEIGRITGAILEDYDSDRAIDKMDDTFHQLDKEAILDITQKLLKIIFPGYYRDKSYRAYNRQTTVRVLIEDVMYHLNKQIQLVLKYSPSYAGLSPEQIKAESQRITVTFFEKIPMIRSYVETDVQAAFDGDPAAFNRDEIIFCYPGLYAIAVNRLAHELYLLSVPLIPRIMTEDAHSKTGIDIHPGATLGKYFCIDHGTGIVVGETTIIGDYVKVYQGVTLGALSTRGGQKLKNTKRHPTIEDHVTIYSGASIFGGETVIGCNCVIGSSAFIITSIEPGTKVSIKNQELQYRSGKKETMKPTDLEQDATWFYEI